MAELRVGGRKIEISNEDRVLYPRDGFTKGDVVRYYRDIASKMVPHLRKRRLTIQRFQPNIDAAPVFQKQIPDHFPDWVHRVTVPKAGGTVTHVVCDNAETLVYLANQGCLTPHVGLQRIDRMEFPDQMIFDLDPPSDGFEIVRSVAFTVREILEQLGLVAFLKTTGSRGLHVVVPLDRRTRFDDVRAFALGVAELTVRRRPEDTTTEFFKNKRGSKLFLDTNRNGTAQTVVPPYAVRALDGAPVAMPIQWDDLNDRGLNARTFTICNAVKLTRKSPDPWKGMSKSARSLRAASDRLAKLL